MNILDVTEEHIFRTLGRGRDPGYKPVDRAKLIRKAEPFDFARLLR
ncbi:MAG: hypothetical protein O8C66_01590 [Candidatus Methanoperedens sp.]|nr:hypothetical protein [Candidatus Methanoperedens sp.]MCZ7369178.1 hypothetical protein [Candidatus Methanoperedens sp.]